MDEPGAISTPDPLTSLARPAVLALAPYRSARSDRDADRIRIYLDANENPYPPYPADGTTDGFNRYPECQPTRLRTRFAEHFTVPADHLLLTRGADEAIDLLVRAFCSEGTDGIIITPPTFPMYAHSAEVQGAFVHEVPLTPTEFQLDRAGICATQTAHPTAKLIFICSPNNPTGNLAARTDILAIADLLFGRALVVVDELYLDYSGAASIATALPEHPNLVVLRSLSKEYSLAGERVGITIAHPKVITLLHRIIAPYPIPQSVIRTTTAAMTEDGVTHARANIDRILAERTRVANELSTLPGILRVYPSDANFLLVRVREPAKLMETTANAGIKIRDRSDLPGTPGAVRISVGTPEENDALLAVARSVCS